MIGRVRPLLQYNSLDPTLVTPNSPLRSSQPTLQDLHDLVASACHYRVPILAGSQIALEYGVFAVLTAPYIIPGKWTDYPPLQPSWFRLVGEPELEDESTFKFKDLEESSSVEGVLSEIWVAVWQKYSFMELVCSDDLLVGHRQKTFKGFETRLWDHGYRLLNGILPIHDQVSHLQIHLDPECGCNPVFRTTFSLLKEELTSYRTDSLSGLANEDMTIKELDLDQRMAQVLKPSPTMAQVLKPSPTMAQVLKPSPTMAQVLKPSPTSPLKQGSIPSRQPTKKPH